MKYFEMKQIARNAAREIHRIDGKKCCGEKKSSNKPAYATKESIWNILKRITLILTLVTVAFLCIQRVCFVYRIMFCFTSQGFLFPFIRVLGVRCVDFCCFLLFLFSIPLFYWAPFFVCLPTKAELINRCWRFRFISHIFDAVCVYAVSNIAIKYFYETNHNALRGFWFALNALKGTVGKMAATETNHERMKWVNQYFTIHPSKKICVRSFCSRWHSDWKVCMQWIP